MLTDIVESVIWDQNRELLQNLGEDRKRELKNTWLQNICYTINNKYRFGIAVKWDTGQPTVIDVYYVSIILYRPGVFN